MFTNLYKLYFFFFPCIFLLYYSNKGCASSSKSPNCTPCLFKSWCGTYGLAIEVFSSCNSCIYSWTVSRSSHVTIFDAGCMNWFSSPYSSSNCTTWTYPIIFYLTQTSMPAVEHMCSNWPATIFKSIQSTNSVVSLEILLLIPCDFDQEMSFFDIDPLILFSVLITSFKSSFLRSKKRVNILAGLATTNQDHGNLRKESVRTTSKEDLWVLM